MVGELVSSVVDDDEVRFVLDQHAWYVAPLGHIFLIPSQPVFVLSDQIPTSQYYSCT
jgi:hypothetical protein